MPGFVREWVLTVPARYRLQSRPSARPVTEASRCLRRLHQWLRRRVKDWQRTLGGWQRRGLASPSSRYSKTHRHHLRGRRLHTQHIEKRDLAVSAPWLRACLREHTPGESSSVSEKREVFGGR